MTATKGTRISNHLNDLSTPRGFEDESYIYIVCIYLSRWLDGGSSNLRNYVYSSWVSVGFCVREDNLPTLKSATQNEGWNRGLFICDPACKLQYFCKSLYALRSWYEHTRKGKRPVVIFQENVYKGKWLKQQYKEYRIMLILYENRGVFRAIAIKPRPCFVWQVFLLCICVTVCVSVCKTSKKSYWTDQLHFWWRHSLWPREGTIRFWKKNRPG